MRRVRSRDDTINVTCGTWVASFQEVIFFSHFKANLFA